MLLKKYSLDFKRILLVMLFVFLLLFDMNLLLNNSSWSLKIINDLIAKTVDDNGSSYLGNEGGGSESEKPARFYNYGTRTETKWCQRTTISSNGVVTITYWQTTVYWQIEYCLYGGNEHTCTYNTKRKTYQGGGC